MFPDLKKKINQMMTMWKQLEPKCGLLYEEQHGRQSPWRPASDPAYVGWKSRRDLAWANYNMTILAKLENNKTSYKMKYDQISVKTCDKQS